MQHEKYTNKMKKYIFIALLLTFTNVFGQTQDSLLRRQLELERDFNPTLLDANKITSLPALPKTTVQKPNTNYSTWAGRTTPSLEIALPQPGSIMTEIPYSTKKGYIKLNAGNYGNMNGALGYRLLEKEKDMLAFTFLHNSSNGKVQYVGDVEPTSNKLFFMDNFAKLNYDHLFDAFKLSLHASYLHSRFNYYGNNFGNFRFFDDEIQRVGVINAQAAVKSDESASVHYEGYFDFKNFSTKFGETTTSDPIAGNQLDARLQLAKPFLDGDSKIGVDGQFFATFYQAEDIKNYMFTGATPYVSFEGMSWKARLGADVLFQLANKTRVRVTPNVHLSLNFTERSSLYANITGGFRHNTFLQMLQHSRYMDPMFAAKTKPAFSPIDIELGAKIGEVNGFRFDIFGGYKQIDNENFLILNQSYSNHSQWAIKESLIPIYANLTHSHVGGMIQSNIWAPLHVTLRLKKNFYTVKDAILYDFMYDFMTDDIKACNLPGWEVDFGANLQIWSNLKLGMNYVFRGDRWTYLKGENLEMDNIHDVSLDAVYNITDLFSLHLKANNIFAQKYDIMFGHPAQGFHAMGGFTFKF